MTASISVSGWLLASSIGHRRWAVSTHTRLQRWTCWRRWVARYSPQTMALLSSLMRARGQTEMEPYKHVISQSYNMPNYIINVYYMPYNAGHVTKMLIRHVINWQHPQSGNKQYSPAPTHTRVNASRGSSSVWTPSASKNFKCGMSSAGTTLTLPVAVQHAHTAHQRRGVQPSKAAMQSRAA